MSAAAFDVAAARAAMDAGEDNALGDHPDFSGLLEAACREIEWLRADRLHVASVASDLRGAIVRCRDLLGGPAVTGNGVADVTVPRALERVLAELRAELANAINDRDAARVHLRSAGMQLCSMGDAMKELAKP